MSIRIEHACVPYDGITLPDLNLLCCYGVANSGPQGCTCWEPVYDLEQQPLQPGEAGVRVEPCADCAYKGGSPERRGEEGYRGDAEFLDRIVATGERFFCHQGMRRIARLRHPSGAEIDGHPAAFAPPIVDSLPYKADGTPGDLCAGWCTRRLRHLHTAGQRSDEA